MTGRTPEVPSALPPEYRQVQEMITNAPTAAPDINVARTNMGRLSADQRRVLREHIDQTLLMPTTAETTKQRLRDLRVVVDPSFMTSAANLPSEALRGTTATFTSLPKAGGFIGALATVGGIYWLATKIEGWFGPKADPNNPTATVQRRGWLSSIVGALGITALATAIVGAGRAARQEDVARAGGGVPEITPPGLSGLPSGTLDISDARFDNQNIFSLLRTREFKFGEAVTKLKDVPKTPEKDARTHLLVRKAGEPETANREFKLTGIHTMGNRDYQGLDLALNGYVGADWLRRRLPGASPEPSAIQIESGTRKATVDLSRMLPGNTGTFLRAGNEYVLSSMGVSAYIKQTDYDGMLGALANVEAPSGGGKRRHSATINAFVDRPGTTPRRTIPLQLQFDEV